MPLYEKGRSAVPLSQLASNGKAYSSSANHLSNTLVFISRSNDCERVAPTTWVKSALGVEEVENGQCVCNFRLNARANMSGMETKGSSTYT